LLGRAAVGRDAVGWDGTLWVEWGTSAMLLEEEDAEECMCWRIQRSSWAERFESLGKAVPGGGLTESCVMRLGLEGLPMTGHR
jgi:hypothetical protein